MSETAYTMDDHSGEDTLKLSSTTADGVSLDVPRFDAGEIAETLQVPEGPPAADVDNSSELSELAEDFDLDDASHQIIKRKIPQQPRITRRALAQLSRLQREQLRGSESPMSSAPPASGEPNPRKPGDYTLTRRLLSTPYSRWVQCRVCDSDFVQTEAYQTRWSCPRCERHSKIYGYQWPKTDKTGKHDTEERIMDHRMVHRFIWADEEKVTKKGRKALHGLLAEKLGSSTAGDSERGSPAAEETPPKKPRKRILAQGDGASESPPTKRTRVGVPLDNVLEVAKEKTGRRTVAKVVESARPIAVSDDGTPRAKRNYVKSGKYSKRKGNMAQGPKGVTMSGRASTAEGPRSKRDPGVSQAGNRRRVVSLSSLSGRKTTLDPSNFSLATTTPLSGTDRGRSEYSASVTLAKDVYDVEVSEDEATPSSNAKSARPQPYIRRTNKPTAVVAIKKLAPPSLPVKRAYIKSGRYSKKGVRVTMSSPPPLPPTVEQAKAPSSSERWLHSPYDRAVANGVRQREEVQLRPRVSSRPSRRASLGVAAAVAAAMESEEDEVGGGGMKRRRKVGRGRKGRATM